MKNYYLQNTNKIYSFGIGWRLTRMHCLARETIASKECRIIGCSHELGNEFVFEVTLFRTNQSCLYFVNNNSSLHSKHFIKFHQFIDNNKLITSLS